jgi:hypothetical protein
VAKEFQLRGFKSNACQHSTSAGVNQASFCGSVSLVGAEDLGQGDFPQVDCAACRHVALLTPEALLRVGLSPAAKVLDLKERLRCRGCGENGRAVVSVRWRGQGA